MKTTQKVKAAPIVLRYLVAGIVAFFAALLARFASLTSHGFSDAGGQLQTATEFVSFAAITAGGFCFPALSRWFGSVILPGFVLVFYRITDRMRATDDYFLQMFPYLLFWPLVRGGCIAAALHSLVDLFVFVTRWPSYDHARDLTRPSRSGCNPRVPRAGSLRIEGR